ncbi:hypothetical protein B296_00055857, partial [Ensete ventricosum]
PTAGPLCKLRAVSDCARGRLSPLRAGRNRSCLWVATAPAGGASAHKHHPCGRLSHLAGVAGLGRGLVMGGRPCMGAGRGWLPLLAPSLRKRSKNA